MVMPVLVSARCVAFAMKCIMMHPAAHHVIPATVCVWLPAYREWPCMHRSRRPTLCLPDREILEVLMQRTYLLVAAAVLGLVMQTSLAPAQTTPAAGGTAPAATTTAPATTTPA